MKEICLTSFRNDDVTCALRLLARKCALCEEQRRKFARMTDNMLGDETVSVCVCATELHNI